MGQASSRQIWLLKAQYPSIHRGAGQALLGVHFLCVVQVQENRKKTQLLSSPR